LHLGNSTTHQICYSNLTPHISIATNKLDNYLRDVVVSHEY